MPWLEEAIRVSKAVSDPTRIRILHALAVRELCVCELTAVLDVGQPVVSRHLGILREAGLVEDVRDGQWVNYRLRRPGREPYGEAVLAAVVREGRDDPDLKADAYRARSVDRHRLRRGAKP